jgi:hypothetical protein
MAKILIDSTDYETKTMLIRCTPWAGEGNKVGFAYLLRIAADWIEANGHPEINNLRSSVDPGEDVEGGILCDLSVSFDVQRPTNNDELSSWFVDDTLH